MSERLQDKVAIVVGAGCTPGETIGNGRATAILFAREGAYRDAGLRVLPHCVCSPAGPLTPS
jgi:NAD(P)-dependent dehydrogenase (short-subunit alcohol dehydrogenase family)